MTLSAHIDATGKNPASVQKQWRRKQMAGEIARPFSRDLEPTDQELAAVFGQSQTNGHTDNASTPMSASPQTDRKEKIQTSKQTETRARTKGQSRVLVGTMLVCAAVSLSNMYAISCQIKPAWYDALLITALFSLAPFGLLYAGGSKWAKWAVSGICIGYEVFCNASGIYRGLAGLGNGSPYEVWNEGGFVDTVSRVTTLEARPCALVISFGMAAIVAAVFLTCLVELKNDI